MEKKIIHADDIDYEKADKIWERVFNERPSTIEALNILLDKLIEEFNADEDIVKDERHSNLCLLLQPWVSGKVVFETPFVIKEKEEFLE